MAERTAETIVREYWHLMGTNDFAAVAAVLAPDVVLEWPMSNERIRGPANIARMNSEYPAHGRWTFTLHRLVACGDEAATDVTVTDGVQVARVVSFFTLVDGRIARLTEFWPAQYEPPANRAHLVERMVEGR